jgi:hypothetical protein
MTDDELERAVVERFARLGFAAKLAISDGSVAHPAFSLVFRNNRKSRLLKSKTLKDQRSMWPPLVQIRRPR